MCRQMVMGRRSEGFVSRPAARLRAWGGLGSLDQDESKSEPVWRSLISGASSGSLYHALAYAMAGHSTPTMTLGS